MTDLQQACLNIAKVFVAFCEEKGLRCFLCGGGCIGAVRHKGFIPWDDDLDFFMPRADYEKLKTMWREHPEAERYQIQYPSETYNDHNMFITIRDAETTLIKDYQKDLDICHGVNIDIFPLDGYPKDEKERAKQCRKAKMYALFCTQLVPKNHGFVTKCGAAVLLGLSRSKKKRYRIWSRAEREMSRYAIDDCDFLTELCAGPRYMNKKYPKDAFEDALWLPFEDTEMPVPAGYDSYLREAFGDYMNLPPEEERIAPHPGLFVDVAQPYRGYYGQKYCVNNGVSGY